MFSDRVLTSDWPLLGMNWTHLLTIMQLKLTLVHFKEKHFARTPHNCVYVSMVSRSFCPHHCVTPWSPILDPFIGVHDAPWCHQWPQEVQLLVKKVHQNVPTKQQKILKTPHIIKYPATGFLKYSKYKCMIGGCQHTPVASWYWRLLNMIEPSTIISF